MATEAFTIAKRPGWGASVTVNIECDPLASMGVKIGLAVRVGHATRANLAGANLARAYLAGADLAGAYLAGANLAGADLAGANLARAYLAGADLAGADLAGAYLAGAYLAGANLARANLARANLTGAYLAGADLAGANLTRAYLAGANLARANLARANLTGANLAGANLAGADLARADLAGANLARANLTGADLAGAEIRGETVTRIVGQAVRLTPGDQYTFTAFEMEAGGVKVLAGCRWFTIPEFRAHVASHYPDTDKAADTLEILDYLERRAVRVGAIKPDVPTPKKPRTKAKPALATQDPDLRGGR